MEKMNEMVPWVKKSQDLPGAIISDTTSRDGLQAMPWWNYWNKESRGVLSQKMSDVGIQHIELGFPALEGDPEYEAVQYAAEQVGERESVVFGLARLVESDIANTIKSLEGAKYRGVHTFVGTSKEHLSTFNFSEEDIIRNVGSRVAEIREANCIAEFSAEDATRTEWDFLVAVYRKAIESGAQIINVPDTLGWYDTGQYVDLLKQLKKEFPNVIISIHAHNDKSQAEQNAMVGLSSGYAQRVEGTLYGIGERAGNTDLGSLIIPLFNDSRYKKIAKNLLKSPEKFGELLKYMNHISGIHSRPVSPGYGYEAIVNRSGIHQAKVAKLKGSYIWNDNVDFGLGDRPQIDITPLSGYNGIMAKFKNDFGIDLEIEEAKQFTALIRSMLSPDTMPGQIHSQFEVVSEKFLYEQGHEIHRIRGEAAKLKNTPENIARWMKESNEIQKATYDHLKQQS